MPRERPPNSRRAEPARVAKRPDEKDEPLLLDVEPSVDRGHVEEGETRMVYHRKIHVPPRAKGRRQLRDAVRSMEVIEHDKA